MGNKFAAISLIVGLVLAGANYNTANSVLFTNLRTSEGSILISRLKKVRVSGPMAINMGYKEICCDIEYRYSVAGTTYQSSRVLLFQGAAKYILGLAGLPEDSLERYPVGKQVQVLYDPKNPSFAVLELGSPYLAVIEFFVGLVCLGLVSVWILAMSWSAFRGSGAT